MRELPTWPVAAGSLLVGFGVAQATGVRALGGVVLAVAALWCGLRWRRAHGLARAVALVGVYLAAFALSHPLGSAIGSWPAVILVAVATGATVWVLAERAGPRAAVS
jgi:hypothetical protein